MSEPIPNGTPFHFGASYRVLDKYVKELVCQIHPARVADIGAGAGKYGEICREALGQNLYLLAVEGCQKTCSHLEGTKRYDRVICTLLQNWEISKEEPFDLIICGDVLEHLTRREVFRTIDRFLRHAKSMLVVVPLRNLEQDEFEGNPLERHNAYLTEADFDKRYVIAEKHSVIQPTHHSLAIWILARRHDRLRDALKILLLKSGGHKMFKFFKKRGLSPEIEIDRWQSEIYRYRS